MSGRWRVWRNGVWRPWVRAAGTVASQRSLVPQRSRTANLITPPSHNTLLRVASLRTFLILGRVSNLPTLWSNCLAGWWLGGAGNPEQLPLLVAGASLLYLSGMFLN